MDEPMVQTWDEISVKTDTFLGLFDMVNGGVGRWLGKGGK